MDFLNSGSLDFTTVVVIRYSRSKKKSPPDAVSLLAIRYIASDKMARKHWYFSYFSTKTYVVVAIRSALHNIGFHGEINKILCRYPLLTGAKKCLLHRQVGSFGWRTNSFLVLKTLGSKFIASDKSSFQEVIFLLFHVNKLWWAPIAWWIGVDS